MTYSTCHRCHAALPPYDDGTLIYCTHCGAPQIQLSEELQTQAEFQAAAAAAHDPGRPLPPDTTALFWRGALRCAGLAAATAAGLALCTHLLPLVGALQFFWILISPVVVLGLFHARFPRAHITTGFGARLGLVTGLGVGLAIAVVNTAALLIARRMHMAGPFDAWQTSFFDQLRSQAAAQAQASPQADAADLVRNFTVPEFRAGWLLAAFSVVGCLLLALTTAGGAVAGFLRSRRNT